MDDLLAIEIGVGWLRASVVGPEGLLTPVLRTSTEAEDGDPIHAARRAAARLGVPGDMWAVAAVHRQRESPLRIDDDPVRVVHGRSVQRLGDALGRPVIAHDAGAVAAAGEAYFGAGMAAKTMALVDVASTPSYSVLTYGQVVATPPLVLAPTRIGSDAGPTRPEWKRTTDPTRLVHLGAQLSLAVVETFEPDAIVVRSTDSAITALTIERVQRIRERRGPTLVPFTLRSSQLGADAALYGCAIWPTASGRFGTPTTIVNAT